MTEDAFSTFCNKNPDEMREWIERVIHHAAYYSSETPLDAFAPFDWYARNRAAETTISALSDGLLELPSSGLEKFHNAFAEYIEKTPSEDPKIWEARAELAWRLNISAAIPALEKQLQAKHIQALDLPSRRADSLLSCVSNITPRNANEVMHLAALLHHFVEAEGISDSQARLTLSHLCEMDPDHWTDHFSRTRNLLDKQMSRILDSKGEDGLRAFQNNVAGETFKAIGFERLSKGLPDIAGDIAASAFGDWLLTSLERASRIKRRGEEIMVGNAKANRTL